MRAMSLTMLWVMLPSLLLTSCSLDATSTSIQQVPPGILNLALIGAMTLVMLPIVFIIIFGPFIEDWILSRRKEAYRKD